jgi:hypothetical protein
MKCGSLRRYRVAYGGFKAVAPAAPARANTPGSFLSIERNEPGVYRFRNE